MMLIHVPATDGSNTLVTFTTLFPLFGRDLALASFGRAFLGIGPGSRMQQTHGTLLVLDSSLVCGAERASFESACHLDTIVTAPFATDTSLSGFVSYGPSSTERPLYLTDDSTEIISLETDGILKIKNQTDTEIRAFLSSRGAAYNVSGYVTHRYVSDCFRETIENLPPLIVHLYNLSDRHHGSPGYLSGSISIDVPITHDPSTNFCYLEYRVVDDTSHPAIPFLTIPGVDVFLNATHISLCDRL